MHAVIFEIIEEQQIIIFLFEKVVQELLSKSVHTGSLYWAYVTDDARIRFTARPRGK